MTTQPAARKWTLRTRLVAALLVLATVALVVFGVASVLLIKKSQVDRIDQRLTDLSRRGLNFVTRPPGPNGRDNLPTEFRVSSYNRDGSLIRTFGQPEGDTGGPRVPVLDAAAVAARDGAPFTVDDRASGPSWRVRVIPAADGYVAVALSLAEVEATVRQVVTIELVVGSVLLIALGAIGFSVVRLGLRPLTRIEQTAAAIARGELDARVPDTDLRTETGRLGRALNTMLARLSSAIRQRERSEARLRRFIADASHELRTPLTSIRGFAELYRRGGATEPSDVDRTMGRIEEEAVRMGRLVDDLLLLARLDEQRSLERDEVDLVVLAADAVHDVKARDPDRRVRLSTPDGPVRVLGDEHRLRQVTMNLVTNAVTHTAAGTPVTVTVAAGPLGHTTPPTATAGASLDDLTEAAILEVRDEGDGIPAGAAPLIFDRFYRVDSGRSRRNGGTGLGLAITAAILEAHHGRIDLHTKPGAGATFRVLLPLAR